MGQRTQVLVIKENNKKQKKCYFFHYQWGFGRVMYMGLMDLFMQDYNKETFDRDYNFLDCKFGTNKKFYDITNEVPQKVLDAVDVKNFDTIKAVFEHGDNNNGGMVVYIKENKTEYHGSRFKVGFLLGYEDTEGEYEGEIYNEGNDKEAFARWLSPEEYGRMNGGNEYSDKQFVAMFKKFCRYFGIKFFK